MKKFKLLAWAFVAGQIATMFYKDKNFRDKFNQVDWFEKVKTLVNSLVDLNKKIFFDIKEYDYETKFNEFKSYFDAERSKIESKIDEIKSQVGKINDEKLQPMIQDIYDEAMRLKEKVVENAEYLDDKYEIKDKANKLVEKAKNIK